MEKQIVSMQMGIRLTSIRHGLFSFEEQNKNSGVKCEQMRLVYNLFWAKNVFVLALFTISHYRFMVDRNAEHPFIQWKFYQICNHQPCITYLFKWLL